jgi:hypothetical protein
MKWAQDHRTMVIVVLMILFPLTLAIALLYSIGLTGYMLLEHLLDA